MATIRNGLWENKQGDLVHKDLIPADKQLEDDFVEALVQKANNMHDVLATFKNEAFEECMAFVEILRDRYSMVKIKSDIGSVTFKNYNGTKVVQIQVAKILVFDNKINLAKEKLDEYLNEITNNSSSDIKTIITRAFNVDNGKVDTKQILSLKTYEIEHPKWLEAMALIDDAVEIASTKSYIRFKESAGINEPVKTILLDIAKI